MTLLNRYLKSYGSLIAYVSMVHVFVLWIWPYVWPLLFAFLLSQCMEPIVARMSSSGLPRGIAAFVTLASGVLLSLLGTAYLAVELGKELSSGLQSWPAVYHALTSMIHMWFFDYQQWESGLPPFLRDLIINQIQGIYQSAAHSAQLILQFIQAGLLQQIADMLWVILFIFLMAFFLSKDRPQIWPKAAANVPPNWLPGARAVQVTFLDNLASLLRVHLNLTLGTWAVFYFYFSWVLGLPYALVLSLLVAILDLMPVIGPGLVIIPWACWNLWAGNYWLAISLGGFFFGCGIGRSYLQAQIMGREMGVHPLIMLLSAYFATIAYGAAGFLIGPTAAIVWVALVRAKVWPGFYS